MYIFLTVISAFLLALYDLFKKISCKKNENIYEILFFYSFIAFVFSLVFIKSAISLSLSNILFLLLKSSIISMSWYFTMKAVSKLNVSIVTPFSMLGVVSTSILASIFFNESIGFVQIGGILVILVGLLLLVKVDYKKTDNEKDYRYLFYLLLSVVLSSISAIIDKKLLVSVDKGAVLFWFFLFLSCIYFSFYFFKNRKVEIKNLKNNLWIVGISLGIFFSDLFYYWALSLDGAMVSVVSIVRKISVFISVVLACVFLKEGHFAKKILILILMFAGLSGILFL